MDRYLLATIFLCLLVTLCNARHFRKHTGVSINQTHKDIEKLWGKVEIVDDQGGGGGGVSDDPRPRKRLRRKRSKGKKQGNSEVAATKISAVEKKAVVSWHVRPPKQHDQLPRIYSDYPKPRSRPPSHN